MNELSLDRRELRSFHLFAGAGGGILGDILLGHRVVGACEIEEYPRNTLLQRQRDGILPRFPIWDDICTFDGRPWRGRVQIICGGFPCQDISAAGKGAGIEGNRSGLWGEMARVIGEIRPRFVFVENSPLLVGRGLAVVLGDLAEMGYDSRWCVLGADSFGAPHRRKRIWILAYSQRDQQPREESCLRTPRRMGRGCESLAWNGDWEDRLSEFRGMDDGVAYRVDRTDAIRNGQVPIVAATAFRILTSEIVNYE